MKIATSLSVAFAALSAGFLAATSPALADYEGRNITLVTNVGPGGVVDVQARLFAQHWQNHVEGQPNIVIESMPGGGMMLGIDFAFRQADPDGDTLAWVAPGMSTRVLGPVEQQIDYDGIHVIGGIGIPVIAYASKDVAPGIEAPADIANVDRITVAGFQPRSGFDLNTIIGLELLEVDYDYVAGFGGGSDIMAAMLRGEAQVATTALNSFRVGIAENFIEPGQGIGLWYIPPIGENGEPIELADVSEAPAFHQLYQEVRGEMPTGPAWDAIMYLNNVPTILVAAPPGTPEELVTILRESFEATTQDEAYLVAVEEQVALVPTFYSADQVQAAIDRVSVLDENEPEMATYLRDLIDRISE